MESWTNLVIFLHVAVAIGIIGLVLLQHGKGADMGSGFGSGTSGSSPRSTMMSALAPCSRAFQAL
jgi:protein translocase SecG subunit